MRPVFFTIVIVSLALFSVVVPVSAYVNKLEKVIAPVTPVLTLVFVSRDYDAQSFYSDQSLLFSRLAATPPFDSFAGRLAWYSVLLDKDEQKEAFRETGSVPPFALSGKLLRDIERQCPGPFKLIVLDALGGSSCAQVSRSDEISLVIVGRARYCGPASFAAGFLHELGHSLGLADECGGCPAASPVPGQPNCAATREEAEKLWGDLAAGDPRVSYIRGCCGRRDYIRPTPDSLMNDPGRSGSFGPVSERFLRKQLGK